MNSFISIHNNMVFLDFSSQHSYTYRALLVMHHYVQHLIVSFISKMEFNNI